jgi:purine-binding chemotaxis protein CheW
MEEVQSYLNLSTQDNSEMEGKYLTFWTDQQLFGIPIADVIQIVGLQKITEIPDSPDYVKGIINLRGAIIPLIDMRLRFHKPVIEYNERTCIIVTSIQNKSVGFIVDAVDEVTTIRDEAISPPPSIQNKDTSNSYLIGIGKLDENRKIVLLLDTSRILSENEFEVLVQQSQSA